MKFILYCNSKSKFEHGHIYFQLDKSYAVSGEDLRGNIFLYLTQPYPADSLYIEINGKEKCKWTQSNGQHGSTRISKSKEIISEEFKIFYFPNKVALPGQYTFPFSVRVPVGLPSTLFFSGKQDSKATIKYTVRAILKPEQSTSIEEMSFENELAMREVPPVVTTDFNSRVSDQIKSWMGLKNHGSVDLDVKFDKD